MNHFNRNQRYPYLVAGLFFIALTLFCASWYIKVKQQDYRYALQVSIADQEIKMTSLANLIDRDEADAVVRQIVKDCSLEDRERFDTLLSSLSKLNRSELFEIQNLFSECGSFFSDRKAILSARLTRELEIYEGYLVLQELSNTGEATINNNLTDWQSLVEIEKERSKLSTELVNIQESIIDLLISGTLVGSEAMTTVLSKAQTDKDSLSFLNIKADEMRNQLSGI